MFYFVWGKVEFGIDCLKKLKCKSKEKMKEQKENDEANSTSDSQMVSHFGTKNAQRCLTSQSGRDVVHST